MLRIGVAIIWQDGKILVAKRLATATHAASKCEFPGGKCDENESFEACAVREAREETGLQVLAGASYDLIEWHYPERSVQIGAFDCEILEGTAQALESERICWLWPHELEANDFPQANGALIEDIGHRAQKKSLNG